MTPDAAFWFEHLELIQHPEGGAFREIYRSHLTMAKQELPDEFSGERNVCTSIYFLLRQGEFSAFHRIASDEIWHFYVGSSLTIYEIQAATGNLTKHTLGPDPLRGEMFQIMIRAGNWFGARCEQGFVLAGCTVSPGFDFAEFELADRIKLIADYPEHKDLIVSLTR
jgi:predicted cupin superfamily sugar epimerase